MMKRLKVIDLFCGVGGLSYGFQANKSFEIVAANEILPSMATAYAINHPSVNVYTGDIKNFDSNWLESDLGEKADDIDIIVGGPPCQAYSTVGKRSSNDPRGKLFREYHRILTEFRPKLFLYENVKGLLSMQGGKLFKDIVSLFESLGYSVQYKLLNAADYGAPQIRERVIIVGSRLTSRFQYPIPTHYDPSKPLDLFKRHLKPYLTLGEAIGDLPLIKSGEESFKYATEPKNEFQKLMRMNAPKKIMDHNAANHGAKLIKIMESLPEGGSPADLPKNLRPTSGFKNTYCRLWWNRPSTTLTRNLGTPSSSRCIHPKTPRPLTTREGARIQCFPDDYKFYGSRSDKNLQIGNAVPTVLSVSLANMILVNFEKEYENSNRQVLQEKEKRNYVKNSLLEHAV